VGGRCDKAIHLFLGGSLWYFHISDSLVLNQTPEEEGHCALVGSSDRLLLVLTLDIITIMIPAFTASLAF
jgi:hypothetical protein